jgi:transposase
VVEGAVDRAVFVGYLEQVLLPTLTPGQSMVLDNLQIHHGARGRQLIAAHGCQMRFLPAYSPDLVPIEEAFAKSKAVLRRLGVRTHKALPEVIGQALATVTAQDARGGSPIVVTCPPRKN